MKAAWAAVRNVRQNMRQICESQKTNEKLPQVHLTPLKLRFALKRQTVPQTEPADPQNRSASSFIVCRSLFLVRCLSSPRVGRVVLVSCPGRVLGAQHDCRNVPSTLSLSHLSFVGCVYAAPPSPLWRLPLALLSAASVTFSMPSKQLLSVCLLLLLLLFFCCFLAAAAANGILATAALPYAVTPLQITVLT